MVLFFKRVLSFKGGLMGTKSELVTSPLPSQWPTRGRECYVTLAFSGSPKKGIRSKLAACHLPLHNSILVSYGEKMEINTFKTLVLE